MRVEDLLDTLSKALTIVSITLYYFGYIDLSILLALVAAASALMSTLLLHRLSRMVRRMVGVRTYPMMTLKGFVSPTCRICTHASRAEIESMAREKGLEETLKTYPELGRRPLANHMRRHILGNSREGSDDLDIQKEMRLLVDKLKDLYARLEIFDGEFRMGGGGITARDYLNSVGERLDIIAKIKDLLLSMERARAGTSREADLTELLQGLATSGESSEGAVEQLREGPAGTA